MIEDEIRFKEPIIYYVNKLFIIRTSPSNNNQSIHPFLLLIYSPD